VTQNLCSKNAVYNCGLEGSPILARLNKLLAVPTAGT